MPAMSNDDKLKLTDLLSCWQTDNPKAPPDLDLAVHDLKMRLRDELGERAEDLPPLVAGERYWINHPELHRRGNPVVVTVVGPDPTKMGRWVVALSNHEQRGDELLSVYASEIGDQEGT